MSKYLWLDTETTGLDPEKNGLIEIGGLVEVGGKIEHEFSINSGIFEADEISEGAAQLQGLSIDDFAKQINDYQTPLKAFRELYIILNAFIDPYKKEDKFTVAGYNPAFDIAFIEAFFKKLGDPYLYSYIRRPLIDVLSICRYLSWAGIINVENHKLVTVCEAFGIELNAHTALDDIRATRELALRIKSMFPGQRGEL